MSLRISHWDKPYDWRQADSQPPIPSGLPAAPVEPEPEPIPSSEASQPKQPEIPLKRCPRCPPGIEKPATSEHFAFDHFGKYQLSSYCRACNKTYYQARKAKRQQTPHPLSVSSPPSLLEQKQTFLPDATITRIVDALFRGAAMQGKKTIHEREILKAIEWAEHITISYELLKKLTQPDEQHLAIQIDQGEVLFVYYNKKD